MENNYTAELNDFATSLGAVLAAAADLELLKSLNTLPSNLLNNYRYGFSIAVSLPQAVIDSITIKTPGEIYAHYYKTANLLLDQISFRLSEMITTHGYSAFAIPASSRYTQDTFMGTASHKAFARAAGLGWIGKNALLITPQYGPRVRLATVLTDIPLVPGKPLKNECGDCTDCIDSCPVKALQPSDFTDYPVKRSNVLNVKKCAARLDRFSQLTNIGVSICGVCVKACPIGRT
jgi:epoxyqueuosine reductase QueG